MNNFVTDLLMRIDQIGQGFSARAYGIVGDQVMPLLKVAFIIYVMTYGIQLIMGTARISVGELVGRTARLMIILALTQNWEFFNSLFYRWLSDTPEDVGRAILSASGTGITEPTNGLSMIVTTAQVAGAALANQSGYFTILPSVLGLLILACALVFAAIAMAILILCKVMMWVLIGTGPIFIGCLLFEQTRSYGVGWFSQVLLYAIIPLFVFVVAAFMIAAINPEMSKITLAAQETELTVGHLSSFLLLTVAGCFVLLNIQSLAQAISGSVAAGVGAAGMGYGLGATLGPARWALSKATGAARGVFGSNNSHPGGGSMANRSSSEAAMQQRISDMSRPR